MGSLRFLAGIHRCNMGGGGWRGDDTNGGRLVNLLMRGQETSGLAWVFKLQTLFEINQTKKINNPKKAKLMWQEKAGGWKLYSPVMAKSYVTNYQHFLYSTHRETIKILLSQITKKVDTNNVCSGQISTHVACFSLRVLKQTDDIFL